MGETKTYVGSCHCGKVRYRVALDLSAPVTACNCSMCGRSGSLLAFAKPEQFALERGEDALSDYQFNRKVIHHLFCSTYGVRSFARGTGPNGQPMIAINTRCLEGVEPAQLNVRQFDGRSL